MGRATIDFGIDLGTTNSVIAVVNGNSAKEFIDTHEGSPLLPSAVWIDRQDVLHVGSKAKQRLVEDPDNAVATFKRKMGTDYAHQFPRSGRKLLPEELSAEVLKILRSRAQEKTQESIESAVITVPAGFMMSANDATRKAAEIAGFKTVYLLQEPVAAAFAYGFQSTSQKKYWLVYDFGGGTFDAAIVSIRDGLIQVVEHSGDNQLGGTDIDWDIVAKHFFPKINAELGADSISRSAKTVEERKIIGLLKREAEDAKISVSRTGKTYKGGVEFIWKGEERTFDYSLSPAELDLIVQPWAKRSITLCQSALKARGLSGQEIERVLMVGGSSLLPSVREAVIRDINPRIDFSIDPMLVVAYGAAIFAGQQVNAPGEGNQQKQKGIFSLDLEYDPVGSEVTTMVGGRFKGPSGESMKGYHVEFREPTTFWRSARIPLSEEGTFIVELHAEVGRRCEFQVVLWNPDDQVQETDPKSLPYTVGNASGRLILSHHRGIERRGNVAKILFEKGEALPKKMRVPVHNAHTLKRGDPNSQLIIPIWEGDHETKADLNTEIARFVLRGDHPRVRRDIPAGTEIELTIECLQGETVKAKVYIEIIDEVFDEPALLIARDTRISVDDLQRDLEKADHELERIRKEAAVLSDSAHRSVLHEIAQEDLVEHARQSVDRAKDDPSTAHEGHRHILKLRAKLDRAAEQAHWPTQVKEAREMLGYTREIVEAQGSPTEIDALREQQIALEKAISSQDVHGLRRATELLGAIRWQVLQRDGPWWAQYFQFLEENEASMTDPGLATRLFAQGRKAIQQDDLVSLKAACRQLNGLLPEESQDEAAARGFGSTLL